MDVDIERASTIIPSQHSIPSTTDVSEFSHQNPGYPPSAFLDDKESVGTDIALPIPYAEPESFDVCWKNGDLDPLNPRSFGAVRKWIITAIVTAGSLSVTCNSSIYSSTYVGMEADFHNSREVSVVGLSMFVLGIALGPMFLGPLSEFCGRRPIYLLSWSFYVIWLIPLAAANNIETVIISRLFNGFAGSAFLTVSGGTVADLFAPNELQAPMAVFTLAPFIGPSLGPLIGGFINYYSHWKWTYYVLLIWTGIMWFMIFFLVPETFHAILLRNKARKLREETGDQRWVAPLEKKHKSVGEAIAMSLQRPFQLLVFEPMLALLCLYAAILLGILYLFFGAFPTVFAGVHHFNEWQIGLTFCGIGVGMTMAAFTTPLWHRIRLGLVDRLSKETGVPNSSQPEFRLPPAIFGGLFVPIGIFIFAWTAYPNVHWIAPIIGSSLFGFGNSLVFTGIFTFLVDAYPDYAASALAANCFVRCTAAAAFPLFGSQMYARLGNHWASSLLAFLTVAMMPFPYLFFKYGAQIRKRSRYATS